jgi:hypothetical protein
VVFCLLGLPSQVVELASTVKSSQVKSSQTFKAAFTTREEDCMIYATRLFL